MIKVIYKHICEKFKKYNPSFHKEGYESGYINIEIVNDKNRKSNNINIFIEHGKLGMNYWSNHGLVFNYYDLANSNVFEELQKDFRKIRRMNNENH